MKRPARNALIGSISLAFVVGIGDYLFTSRSDDDRSSMHVLIGKGRINSNSRQISEKSIESEVVIFDGPEVSQHNVVLKTPLSKIFDSALNAKNSNERHTAFVLASHCLSLTIPRVEPTSDSDIIAASPDKNPGFDKVKSQSTDAYAKLTKYCSTGDSNQFLMALKLLPKPTIGQVALPLELGYRTENKQEYMAVLTEVLGSPSIYPTQLDAWLNNDFAKLFTQADGMSVLQSKYVQDQIFRTFVVDENLVAYRDMLACATQFICPSNSALTDEQKTVAQAYADKTILNIKQQRFDVFQSRY